MENEILNNNNSNNEMAPKFNASSGTGVMGSLIFVGLMVIFMIVLANFMN